MQRTRTAIWPALLLLLPLTAGCVSDSSHALPGKKDVGPWLEPSPSLQIQIDEQADRLPWTHGVERIELIRWFATVGEPAYPKLLELAADPRPDVAGSALAALGSTNDSRLVEPIRALTWSYRLPRPVQLERARALVRLGDWSEVPTLIEGLEDEDVYVRALCSKTLFDLTRERFGYDPNSTQLEREQAVERWWGWWRARSLDPLAEREA
jgi:hypothetical protein